MTSEFSYPKLGELSSVQTSDRVGVPGGTLIAEMACPRRFYNTKARHILATTRILRDQHGGRVPAALDKLLDLPGVGPKMGLLVMQIAFHEVVGISVDTHVHRISKQLGWADPATAKRPEQTRKQLEARIPRRLWGEVGA